MNNKDLGLDLICLISCFTITLLGYVTLPPTLNSLQHLSVHLSLKLTPVTGNTKVYLNFLTLLTPITISHYIYIHIKNYWLLYVRT